MLTLNISRSNGNSSAGGTFPFSGQYGIEDVLVRGSIIAGVDERAPERGQLVESIFARIARVEAFGGTSKKEIICEQRVWKAATPAGEKVSKGEWKFKLVVPKENKGLSRMDLTCGLRAVSVVWRVEACTLSLFSFFQVVKHAQFLVADANIVNEPRIEAKATNDLKLIRRTSVKLLPSSPFDLEWAAPLLASPSTSAGPSASYRIRVPNRPFHTSAPLPIHVSFHLPAGCNISIENVGLTLKRTTRGAGPNAPHATHSTKFRSFTLPPPSASASSSTSSISASTTKKGRTPSPTRPPPFFPLRADAAADVEAERTLEMKLPTALYSHGETGGCNLFSMTFALTGKVSYKVKGTKKSVELVSCPIHVCPPLPPVAANAPQALAPVPQLLRRNSDFPFQLSPTPLVAPPFAVEERRHSSTNLALPHPGRPHSGRRMSEQIEPARTRARRDPPVPIVLPPLSPSTSLSSLPTEPNVSRSSTIETFGPDTPNSMEFLITPALTPTLSTMPHSPPIPQYPLTHVSPPRHSARPPRASARHSRDHRPRSAGSTRSSIHGIEGSARSVSNISIASLTSIASGSGSSVISERRSTRELSAPPGIIALSLGDGGREMSASPPFPYRAQQQPQYPVDVPMATSPLPPHRPSPSPPSSSEPPSPVPSLTMHDAFQNPFATSTSPFSMSVVDPDGAVEGFLVMDDTNGASNRGSKLPPSRLAANEIRDIYVSPRASPSTSSSYTTTPLTDVNGPGGGGGQRLKLPSPPLGSLKLPSFSGSCSATAGAPPAQTRRASLVGGLLSRITRRGSKAQ
ncbi:hypothetical protein JCM11641_001404 [Rhodosporidiobolus odoratus]